MNGIDASRVEQNAFRQRRLARINVSGNSDISQLCHVVATEPAK
jgi:hypothetical protein